MLPTQRRRQGAAKNVVQTQQRCYQIFALRGREPLCRRQLGAPQMPQSPAKAPQQRSKKCRKGAENRSICRCTAPRCRLRPAVFPRSAWGPGVLKGTSCSLNRDQQGHDQGTGSLPRQATGIRGQNLSAQENICPRWTCRRRADEPRWVWLRHSARQPKDAARSVPTPARIAEGPPKNRI